MAFTAPTTRATDFLVTAAVWNTEHVDNMNTAIPHLLARKSADTSRASTTVLADDPHLTWAIGATESWMFKLGLWVTSASGTPDFKVALTVPASTTFIATGMYRDSANTITTQSFNVSGTSVDLAVSATTGQFFEFSGIVETAGTSGNVVCQWAQNTSDATATILQANSYFVGVKLA